MLAGKRDFVGGCPSFAQRLALRANKINVLPLIEECARWKKVGCRSPAATFPPITPECRLSVVSSLREKKTRKCEERVPHPHNEKPTYYTQHPTKQ